MLAIYLAAIITPVSTFVFDEVGRAHAGLGAASLTATSNLTSLGTETRTKYEVRYRRPTEYRLRTFAPNGGPLVLDVAIGASKITIYDPALLQYVEEPRAAGEPLGQTVAEQQPNLNDLLLSFADRDGARVWIEDISRDAWKFESDGRLLALSYDTGGTSIVLHVSRESFLIERVDSFTGFDQLSWKLEYDKAVRPLKFVPPAGAFEVPFFDKEMRPPTYRDDAARAATERMFDAYSGLRSIGYEVTRGDAKTTIRLRGRFTRQDDDTASWTYDGRTLVAHHKSEDRWYRGELDFPGVIDAIASLDTRVDPTLRHLMTGVNPYRKRLGHGVEVRVGGRLPVKGEATTMLLAESDDKVITLIVRDSDGLVLRSSMRSNRPGPIASESVDLAFSYFDVPSGAATQYGLQAPAGATTSPVSALMPKTG